MRRMDVYVCMRIFCMFLCINVFFYSWIYVRMSMFGGYINYFLCMYYIWMYVCTYLSIYVCVYMYIFMYVRIVCCTYTCACGIRMCMWRSICKYVLMLYVFVYKCKYFYSCVYVRMSMFWRYINYFLCMYVCMYVCLYVCMEFLLNM